MLSLETVTFKLNISDFIHLDQADLLFKVGSTRKLISYDASIVFLVKRCAFEMDWLICKIDNISEEDVFEVDFDGAKFGKDPKSTIAFHRYICTKRSCSASFNLIQSSEAGRILAIRVNPTHMNHRVVSFIFASQINSPI